MATKTDLLTLIGTDTTLSKVAGTRGGEYAGPCSFCGGTDRFRAHPAWQGGEWHCRNCSPDDRWHSIYDYAMKRDGLTFIEAKTLIDGPQGASSKPLEDPQTYPDRHGCTWADYATWGATLDLFTDYGKGPSSGQVFDGLFFPDASGGRWRLFNHPKSKFMPAQAGQDAVLYGVPEAVKLANATGQDMLYLVNGQPSVIACHAHGVPAFTVPGGESGIAGHLTKTLYPLLMAHWSGKIRVVLDGDATGYKSAPAVVDALAAAGYIDVAALDAGQGHDAADLCILSNGTSPDAFRTLPLLYPLPPPPHTPVPGSAGVVPTTPPTRYQIDVTSKDMIDLLPQAWDAVVALNNPPTLFRRDAAMVTLRAIDDRAQLESVTATRMRGILARSAIFMEQKHNGRVPWLKPDSAIIDDMCNDIDLRIPCVDRIVQVPICGSDGRLLDVPGYHAASRLYYHPRHGLIVPPVSANPTEADLEVAKDLIYNELLIDFPFVAEADRTHAVAMMLLPYVREMINGATPLHLFEAPVAGTGKGRLVEILLMPLLGQEPATTSEAGDDNEWRKTLTALLAKVPEVIWLDNINRTLDSGAFSNMLTASRLSERILGTSTTVDVPIRCVWAMTANNMFMSKEVARRSIRVRIDAKMENPHLRHTFKHHPIKSWVREHQGELIAACLTLVRYGLQHGTTPTKTLGSYEQWAAVMGKILAGCGITDFLGNLQELYDRTDAEGAAWRALVSDWWTTYGDIEVGVKQIFSLLDEASDLPIRGKDEKAQRGSFGKLLRKKQDVVINGKQVVYAGTTNNVVLWKLREVNSQP
jgi:hypothetical protein